jgi:hypothetical protein
MNVPAKRARLAPRELKLLDLDDDALIMIIEKLDHRSKKQMMLTCKRFEGLIGHTHQFYKNFKIRYIQKESMESKHIRLLKMVRRRFGIVEISNRIKINSSHRHKSLKPPIQEFLKKIGADILKIKFNGLFFFKSDFWKLMKFLPRIQELEMTDAFLSNQSNHDIEIEGFELQELSKLEISGSTDLEVFGTIVPASLTILRFDGTQGEYWDAEVLGKQKQLEELYLQECGIKDFKFDPENCHIKKLEIHYLNFLNDSAFEKFSDFMKIQESVTELKIGIYEEYRLKNHNHARLLEHLLSLKTLNKVTIDCKHNNEIISILSSLKVCNPAVDTLIIMKLPRNRTDLKSLPNLFPSVTDLKINWKFPENNFYRQESFWALRLDLQPINSMKQIRKFEIEYLSKEMLAQLDLNQLQEFRKGTSNETSFVARARNNNELETVNLKWRTFIDRHNQLEILVLPYCHISVEQLQIALENLPLLKNLRLRVGGYNYGFATDIAQLSDKEFVTRYEKEQAERAAQLIAENYDRLENLHLNFVSETTEKSIMSDYLKSQYPSAKLYKYNFTKLRQ